MWEAEAAPVDGAWQQTSESRVTAVEVCVGSSFLSLSLLTPSSRHNTAVTFCPHPAELPCLPPANPPPILPSVLPAGLLSPSSS